MSRALFALAGAVLALAVVLYIRPGQVVEPRQVTGDLALQKLDELAARVDNLSREVGRLGDASARPSQSQDLAQAGVQTEAGMATDNGMSELEARVAQLETRLGNPSLQALVDPYERTTPAPRTGNARGEALFAAEPAVENRVYQDVVVEAFAGLGEAVDLNEVACRGSVCRVSYGPAGDSGAQGVGSAADDALLGALMRGFGVRQLQMHHGPDGNGGKVVYIEVP